MSGCSSDLPVNGGTYSNIYVNDSTINNSKLNNCTLDGTQLKGSISIDNSTAQLLLNILQPLIDAGFTYDKKKVMACISDPEGNPHLENDKLPTVKDVMGFIAESVQLKVSNSNPTPSNTPVSIPYSKLGSGEYNLTKPDGWLEMELSSGENVIIPFYKK